ncbi:MAG: multicopper oxidase domain-containing protein, partial [bacterium]
IFQTGDPLDYFPQYLGKYKEQIFSMTVANKVQTNAGLMMSSLGNGSTGSFKLDPVTKVPVGWQKYVNGQLNPEMTMQPGETQIWTLAGVGRNGAFNLGITDVNGQTPWQSTILAFDGNGDNAIPRPYTQVAPTTFTTNSMMVLDPGERITLAVTAPTTPGTYYLVDGLTPQYSVTASPFALMTIKVAGPVASEPVPTFGQTGAVPDLYDPNIKVDNYRSFNFASGRSPDGKLIFTINGQVFGQAPIVNLQAGQVEQWTFYTNQGNPHPIHLHQNMMAIVAVNGQPVKVDGSGTYPYVSYRDIANIPANGSVTVRFRVTSIPGKYVSHCHILMHEDAGMMMAIVAGPNGSQLRVAAGALPGQGGDVVVNDGFGQPMGTVNPFGPKWKGGAATATGNLSGDLTQEIVVGAATPGHTGAVVVYDGQTLKEISRFNAFPEFRHTGVSLAIADLDQDGVGEIIAGRVGQGRSLVRVFEMDGTLVNEIRNTLPGCLPNGVNVAGADFNGDNFDDLAIGAGKGALPRVVGLDGYYLSMPGDSTQVKLFDFLAAPGKAKTGVNLAAGFLAPATQPDYVANLITAPAQGIDNAKISVWQVNAPGDPMGGMGGMGMGGDMGMPVSVATILPYGVNRRSVPGGLRLQTTTFGNTGVFALADWNSPHKIMYQAVDMNGNTIKLKLEIRQQGLGFSA